MDMMLKLAGNIQVRADFSCTGETFVVAARAVYHRDFFNLLVFVADRENRIVAQKFFDFFLNFRKFRFRMNKSQLTDLIHIIIMLSIYSLLSVR